MADVACPECDALQETIPLSVNTVFVVTNAILIFLMQPGFAFIEAGSVRAKNTTNILVKNVIDAILGTLVYWAIGYAFGFGSTNNGMIGTNKFFLINTPASEYKDFFFQYVFAVTSATIVSGAIAERATLHSYLVFTVFMTGFIYPVVTHWVWCEGGWLLELGFIDFAGSAVVHIVGGAAALSGCIILGPRLGRFEKGRILPIPGHSTVLITLGYFMLWFGFFAFNGGSEGGISGFPYNPDNVSRAVVNTALAGAAGTMTTLFILKLAFTKTTYKVFGREFKFYTVFGGYWSLTGAVNGGICGMAAVCAGCAMVEPWAGVVIGCVAGAAYCWWSIFFMNLHLDDPVHACAIHLGGGFWGPLAAALFCHPDRTSSRLHGESFLPDGGVVYLSSDAFIIFGVQVIGCAVIFLWSFACSSVVFGTLRLLGWFRVSAVAEEDGLDFINGEPAYPIDPAILGSSSAFGSSEDHYGTDESDDLPKT